MDGERTNTICLAVISSLLMELQHEKSTLISASLEKRETERLCPSMEAAFPLSFLKTLQIMPPPFIFSLSVVSSRYQFAFLFSGLLVVQDYAFLYVSFKKKT